MKEIWKDIKNYIGKYQISNFGRVKSLSRTRKYGRHGKDTLYKIPEITLKLLVQKNGYCYVSLYKNGKPKMFRIHKIVLETFVSKRPKNHQCNHRDGDKENNKLSNLEWVTSSENIQHAYDNGLIIKERKLSDKEIKEVRKLHTPYKVSMSFLAKKYNVGTSTICRAIHI